MLHRSFKPAKCKTALKMASSRTKLLKNKKEGQVKLLRKELAQLLESGQVQNARIRVEHVVREEKMMTAFELIEIFCELIAARLPIIESQKNCPIDLKEAIASVVFASPRCSDIPELVDVRKHFTAKYGKEFIAAAVELRPDCGVNRNLVEKLSTKAPDGQTKLRILTAIAEEHNIKWDPNSVGEKDLYAQQDLLNGPNAFENSSKMHAEPSNVQTSYYDKGPPKVHTSPQYEVEQESSANYDGNNIRTSLGSQNIAPLQTNVSSRPSPDLRSSGNEMQGMVYSNQYSTDLGRQNWNMEFKDATSAAQAAAESAERASMAARAAAELSSKGKIISQYSPETQRSSAHLSKDELSRIHSGPNSDGEGFARVPMANVYNEKNQRMQTDEVGGRESHSYEDAERSSRDGHKSTSKPGQSVTSTSSKASFKDSRPSSHGLQDGGSWDPVGANYQAQASGKDNAFDESNLRLPDDSDNLDETEDLATVMKRLRGDFHEGTSVSRPSTSMKSRADSLGNVPSPDVYQAPDRNAHNIAHQHDGNSSDESSVGSPPGKFDGELFDEMQDSLRHEDVSNSENRRLGEHSSRASSHSSFSSRSSDRQGVLKSDNQRSGEAITENPFADLKEEHSNEDSMPKSGHTYVVFDDYDDGENEIFDLDKGPESSLYAASPDRKTTWSPRRTNLDPSPFSRKQHFDSVFSESVDDSAAKPQLDDLPPAVFDDASGSQSESEDELDKSEREQKSMFHYGDEKLGRAVSPSSSESTFGLNHTELTTSDNSTGKRNQNQPLHSPRMSSVNERNDSGWVTRKSDLIKDSEASEESNTDGDSAFYLGNVTGGLRNKLPRRPPYVRSSSGESSSAKLAAVDDSHKLSYSPQLKTSIDSEGIHDTYGQKVDVAVEKPRRKPEESYRSSSHDGEFSTHSSADTSTRYRASPPVKEATDSENDSEEEGAGIKKRQSTRITGTYLSSNSRMPQDRQKLDSDVRKKSGSRGSSASLDSEWSDSKDDPPAEVATGKATRFTGLSRRTKGSPTNTGKNSNLKSSFGSEEAVDQELTTDIEPPKRSPYTRRSSNLKSTFASAEAGTQERTNMKPSFQGSYTGRTSISNSTFAYEEAEDQELIPDTEPSKRSSYTGRSSNLKSNFAPEEMESPKQSPYTSRSSNLRSTLASEQAGTLESTDKKSSFLGLYTGRRSNSNSTFASEEAEYQELSPDMEPPKRSPYTGRSSILKSTSASEEAGTQESTNKKSSFQGSYTGRRSNSNSTFASEEAEDKKLSPDMEPPKRSPYTGRSTILRPTFASEEAGTQERTNMKSSFQGSYIGRRSNPSSTFASEEAGTREHSVGMTSEETGGKELSQDGMPTKRSSYKERNSNLKYTASDEARTQDRSSDMKPSSGSSYSDKSFNMKFASASDEAGRTQERHADKKPFSKGSYITETSTDVRSETEVVDSRRSSGQLRAGKVESEKPNPEPRRSFLKDDSNSSAKGQASNPHQKTGTSEMEVVDSRRSSGQLRAGKVDSEKPNSEPRRSILKDDSDSSGKGQASDPPKKTAPPGAISESSKTTNPTLANTSRENSLNKASHVHPKLPDSDTFAAHFQALWASRK